MRVKTYTNGGYSRGGFTSPGGTMTGPLILSGNPTENLHAAPKQYVDSVLASFSASKFTTGTIQVSRLPALTGDAVAATGSNTINLISTGVSAGVYTKVSVNAKGLITTASALSEADIPAISWSKITTGKPTTLAGYGITDAVSLNGGLINGDLGLHADPVNPMHLATKQYVDAQMLANSGAVTGDVYLVNSNAVPSGYLRLNGSDVSKTTYSALYAVVGDAFATYIQPGSGEPWRQQYEFNTTQTADITGWTTGTSLPGAVGNSQAIVTKNRVYLLGGYNGSAHVATVYTAPVNADGTLGAWSTGTALPGALANSQAIVTKNRVHLLGGYNGSGFVSTVYTAPINADGTLGTWTTGTSLPGVLGNSKAIITKNRVYLMGGNTGPVRVDTVYTAPINADGTLGTWSTGTSLPGALANSQAIVTKNRVYLSGGFNGSNVVATVYTAPINADGTLGAWSAGTALPGALGHLQAIVTKNRVYLLGGWNGSTHVATVYTAPVNADGTLGAWTTGTSLPGALGMSQAIVTQNRVYLLGGAIDVMTTVSTVYTAAFSGGLNDYTAYYDGSLVATDPSSFRLPDTTSTDPLDAVSVIKT